MLGLKLKTDPRWVRLVETNLEGVLTDHAWCEQKAATNAMALIIQNSEKPELVEELIKIAREELEHFQMVFEIIQKRGYTLGREQKDNYVNQLFIFMNKGGSRIDSMVERLLFAAMIEARSCERFKTLSENINDPELAKFYRDLMESEAGHYMTFLNFARKYGDAEKVNKRWQEWLTFENELITKFGKDETIHG